MKAVCMLFLLLAVLLPPDVLSQDFSQLCADGLEEYVSDPLVQRGGLHMTSTGIVRALVVFVQFRDENRATESTAWPLNQQPEYFSTYLDPGPDHGLYNGNLSHYYREMSFERFVIYGDPHFVITNHTERYYTDTLMPGNLHYYGEVNREVLQTLNTVINYADYDNWTFTPYDPTGHHLGPDGNVDLIIMLYRNINYPGGHGGMNGSGIATLGLASNDLYLDGKTIKFGFPGSGVTNGGGYMAQIGGTVMDGVLGSVKHEIGHLLFGAGHPQYTDNYYAQFTVWGIMGNYATNAWERERMGWISFDNVTENQTSSLADFTKTGHAYRIVVPNTGGNEAFIIENHQNLSLFDSPNRERPGKGLFILHVLGSDVWHPTYDIEVAEGKFNWANPYWTMPTFWNDSLPVFRQGLANRNGYDGRDNLPNSKVNSWFPIFFIDNGGTPLHVDRYIGSAKDAFNFGYNQMFSPWSNPTSDSWYGSQTSIAVEITGVSTGGNGEDIFTLNFYTSNPQNGSPSKPQLGWDPRDLDGPYQRGWVYLAWGADFWDGRPIEPDINWSELQRKVGTFPWVTVYSGPNRVWSDGSITYDPNGSTPVYFRVRVRDTQNKWSVWSDLYDTKMMDIQVFDKRATGANSSEFDLSQNYPNPFNPTTMVKYQLAEDGIVTLQVFDILGREVSTIAKGLLPAGYYSATFNADNLASGVYFVRFTVSNDIGRTMFSKMSKLLLVR